MQSIYDDDDDEEDDDNHEDADDDENDDNEDKEDETATTRPQSSSGGNQLAWCWCTLPMVQYSLHGALYQCFSIACMVHCSNGAL